MRAIYGLLCLSVVLCTEAAYNQVSKKPPATAPTAYTFMGLTLGQSEADATSVIGALNSSNGSLPRFERPTCETNAPGLSGPGLKICVFSAQQSVPLSPSFALLFVDDKLASINYDFDQAQYPAMVQAIVKKYGAPKSSQKVVMENRMGASFQGKVYSWSNPVSEIRANEYATTVDKSTVHVEDLKLVREFVKRAHGSGPEI